MREKDVFGVVVPVITPVHADETVDEVSLRGLLKRCLQAGVNAVFIGGSAGMGPLLLQAQWQKLMEIAIDEINGRCIVLAGVIETSTKRAIERIRVLERIGYSNIVVTPTYYIKIDESEQFIRHFGRCRDSTSMNMGVYNIPSCTGSYITTSAICEMAKRNWFSFLKESSGDRNYFSQVLTICKQNDLTVLQGNEPDIVWGFRQGAKGIVPVLANYQPELFVQAYTALLNEDWSTLENIQVIINGLRKIILLQGNWIAGISYATSLLGVGQGFTLCPLGEVSEGAKIGISSLMFNRNSTGAGTYSPR
jgi:4-hydroxy-tetrahydrodipicolinate synthase